jgi:chromosome segregation ATPase
MKQILILTCTIALVFPIALMGCNTDAVQKSELENLKAALEKTESERDDLKARIDIVTQARDNFREQLMEFGSSRDQLQGQVEELTQSRDAAVTTAKNDQEQINNLENKLQIETQKISQIGSQLKQIQTAIAEIQDKLNL